MGEKVINHNCLPPGGQEHVCPECKVERADYVDTGDYLPNCPNCDSNKLPTP